MDIISEQTAIETTKQEKRQRRSVEEKRRLMSGSD